MPQHLICHNCHTPLTIQDYAPKHLTCPHCLAVITNPHPGGTGPQPADIPRTRTPIPVLPLDDDTARDFARTDTALIALVILFVIGFILSLFLHHVPVALVLFLTAVAIAAAILHTFRQSQTTDTPQPRTLHFQLYAPPPSGLLAGCAKALAIAACVILLLFGLCCAMIMIPAGSNGFH